MEEGLQVVRSLLRDDETNFEGKYYKLSNAVCTPKPVQNIHSTHRVAMPPNAVNRNDRQKLFCR